MKTLALVFFNVSIIILNYIYIALPEKMYTPSFQSQRILVRKSIMTVPFFDVENKVLLNNITSWESR